MEKLQVNNDRMAQFSATITEQVREILAERGDDILRAFNETVEESQTSESDFPKMKLAFAATVDLETQTIKTDVSWAVRYKQSLMTKIEDPNQTTLAI